ncbi:hypothetical protein SAMN04488029_1201 [Reichenbachiella faecimaris]|uniref:Uncharacterized protein n=1 Tax=Reichenbachiella faecimaris TaxID=692418 RepID=A0A1W2G883_REIFA|nr:hypothetical protein SAMN04488029_1201 [Reichenbachiella faecimaris]
MYFDDKSGKYEIVYQLISLLPAVLYCQLRISTCLYCTSSKCSMPNSYLMQLADPAAAAILAMSNKDQPLSQPANNL